MRSSLVTVVVACLLLASLSVSAVPEHGLPPPSPVCRRRARLPEVERIGEGVLVHPESIETDSGGLLYTGTNDGSVMRVNPVTLEVSTYAYSVPGIDRTGCGQPANEPRCGRVLGLRFDSKDNLYLVDAYKGLIYIPRNNVSDVRVLSTESEGVPFVLLNGLALTENEDTIYFTDTTLTYTRPEFMAAMVVGNAEGRLLKYDISTGTTTTILSNIPFANGVTFSADYQYLAVVETNSRVIGRYWVKGPNAGTYDKMVLDIGGTPDNIVLDKKTGNYFVGLQVGRNDILSFFQSHRELADAVLTYFPEHVLYDVLLVEPGGFKVVTPEGKLVKELIGPFELGPLTHVAEAHHIGDYIYLGGVMYSHFLGRFPASWLDEKDTLVCV